MMAAWLRAHTFAKAHLPLGVFVRARSSSVRPELTAEPCRALIDDQIQIRARLLPPLCPVTLSTHFYCDHGHKWQSYAHYNTDSDGNVNLCRDSSVGGSYVGCEPMGLFWALQPAPGAEEELRLRKQKVQAPYIFNVSVSEGHVSPEDTETQTQGSELASVSIERWYMAPGVRRIEVREDGLVGTLFLPPGPGPFPAVLDLWGMGGGLIEYRSALLASRGYAGFSLAYFGHKELPGPHYTINVGDTYFKKAYQFLQQHDQICEDRVGIIGLSYGSYLTLKLATFPEVEPPACCVGISPAVGSIFTLDAEGRTLPFDYKNKHVTISAQRQIFLKPLTFPENFPPQNKVEVEKLSCPVLCIVGEDDDNNASAENADLIQQTLNAAGKGHLFSRLTYPGAGHLIEPPYAPLTTKIFHTPFDNNQKFFTAWGGHPVPHAAAQEDAWRKMLQFMNTHLRH